MSHPGSRAAASLRSCELRPPRALLAASLRGDGATASAGARSELAPTQEEGGTIATPAEASVAIGIGTETGLTAEERCACA